MEKPWHDHYEEGVPKTFAYPEVPIYQLLEETSRSFPDRTAIVFLGTKLTYRQLDELVKRFACAITALGVKQGDRVACILPNCPQFVVA